MNPRIRAHRILSHLSRYVAGGDLLPPTNTRPNELGDIIGIYYNPEPGRENIEIWDNGLFLLSEGKVTMIPYKNMISIELTDAKNSEFLKVITKSSGNVIIPVRGTDGKFRDSLEMLRFLNRVMEDQ